MKQIPNITLSAIGQNLVIACDITLLMVISKLSASSSYILHDNKINLNSSFNSYSIKANETIRDTKFSSEEKELL